MCIRDRAAAACHSTAELRAGDLKHHAGLVALTAHEAGGVGDGVTAAGHALTGGNDIQQVGGQCLEMCIRDRYK